MKIVAEDFYDRLKSHVDDTRRKGLIIEITGTEYRHS